MLPARKAQCNPFVVTYEQRRNLCVHSLTASLAKKKKKKRKGKSMVKVYRSRQRGFSSAWRSAAFGAMKSRPREGAVAPGAAHMHRVHSMQRAAPNHPGSTREARHFLAALANCLQFASLGLTVA